MRLAWSPRGGLCFARPNCSDHGARDDYGREPRKVTRMVIPRSKFILISTLQVLLQQRRLQICQGVGRDRPLVRELQVTFLGSRRNHHGHHGHLAIGPCETYPPRATTPVASTTSVALAKGGLRTSSPISATTVVYAVPNGRVSKNDNPKCHDASLRGGLSGKTMSVIFQCAPEWPRRCSRWLGQDPIQ